MSVTSNLLLARLCRGKQVWIWMLAAPGARWMMSLTAPARVPPSLRWGKARNPGPGGTRWGKAEAPDPVLAAAARPGAPQSAKRCEAFDRVSGLGLIRPSTCPETLHAGVLRRIWGECDPQSATRQRLPCLAAFLGCGRDLRGVRYLCIPGHSRRIRPSDTRSGAVRRSANPHPPRGWAPLALRRIPFHYAPRARWTTPFHDALSPPDGSAPSCPRGPARPSE